MPRKLIEQHFAPTVRPGTGFRLNSRLTAWLLAGSLWLLMAGCADSVRHTIDRPFIDAPIDVDTIFGEATLGEGRSKEAIANIKNPELPQRTLTLDDCLTLARKVSPAIDSADQAYMGAMWSRWQAITNFLPTASTSYVSNYNDDPVIRGHDTYAWGVTVSQPIFTGGSNIARYLLSQLGLAAADIQKAQAREELMLGVKQAYFGILASERALTVARATVVNLSSHLNVARNFYDVGMVPQNQVLQAEVELAKAQQTETTQARNLEVNKARLNILLRQPVDYPISIKDELKFDRFPLTLDDCLKTGLADNPEIRLGRNQVDSGAKTVDLAKAALLPKLEFSWSNQNQGYSPSANDSAQWSMAAVASFNFWEWGRSKADLEISKVGLNQAINTLTSLEDNTKLEVTSNYQTLISAGRNISVASKAVQAAAEDLRMVSERYQEQVATNTEVLDAQTRYSEAQYEYYQALYNYNLAWASLERTMGRRVTQGGLAPREPTNLPNP
ncbi:MAG: TolC family protein [Deltaproteobacteria bacterium]|jgi:outer membrane protein|nr:TolC family protein [Deltaproteobacteria bacterium]